MLSRFKNLVCLAVTADGFVGWRVALKGQAVILSPFAGAAGRGLGGVDVESGDVFTPTSLRTSSVSVPKHLLIKQIVLTNPQQISCFKLYTNLFYQN